MQLAFGSTYLFDFAMLGNCADKSERMKEPTGPDKAALWALSCVRRAISAADTEWVIKGKAAVINSLSYDGCVTRLKFLCLLTFLGICLLFN